MPITVPTTPPLSAYLMQRVEWISSFSDFAAADGWAVVLSLTGPSKGDGFDVSGSDAGAGEWTFLFETDQMCAGSWPWQIWASHATSGRHLLKKGAFTMLPGFFEGAQDGDSSTHVSRMLELITARLEDRLTLDSENYTIGGRSLSRIPIAELMTMQAIYQKRRRVELAELAGGVKVGAKRRIAVRF